MISLRSDTEYHLDADVPGSKREDIKLSLQPNNFLLIETKKFPKFDKDVTPVSLKYFNLERLFGTESRSISLPADADLEFIKASYQNGTLLISVPKKTNVHNSAKDIEIENLI